MTESYVALMYEDVQYRKIATNIGFPWYHQHYIIKLLGDSIIKIANHEISVNMLLNIILIIVKQMQNKHVSVLCNNICAICNF